VDPDETVRSIISAFARRDRAAARRHKADLVLWLKRGGFMPSNWQSLHPATRRSLLNAITASW
jgi:hypothetical protein